MVKRVCVGVAVVVGLLMVGRVQAQDTTTLLSRFLSFWVRCGTGGHLLVCADNTYDIGASGATRPRSIFAGTDIRAAGELGGNFVQVTGAGYLYWSTGTAFGSLGTPANGAMLYCTDCTVAATCAGAGTGAFAKRLNSAWVCN